MRYIFLSFVFGPVLFLCGCGPSGEADLTNTNTNDQIKNLTQEEKDYVERFNVVAKDIRDFPPKGKDIEQYFYVFKSVAKLEDAKIIFFGEIHTNAANRLWTAGTLNSLIKSGDAVLFEGYQAGSPTDIPEQITTSIFAAREYEKLKAHKIYKPTAISKIQNKYFSLFQKTKPFLALDQLNLEKGRGFFWDLFQGDNLHPNSARRNEEMVQTIRNKQTGTNRVFVIAGALHLPHYEFAYAIKSEEELDLKFPLVAGMPAFLAKPGAKKDQINLAFFDHWGSLPKARWGTTRSIFEFLKDKDFAILIPKNLPEVKSLEPYFPKNVR